jgi:hypothetical protein
VGSGSTLTVTGNYTNSAGTTEDDGTLTLLSSGALDLNGGTLDGDGKITGAVTSSSAGTIMPGDSTTTTGTLKDTGAYNQNSGTLDIAIDGTTSGTKYDVFNPSTATLSGTLNISLPTGFVPTVGTTFKIMNFTSETGTFATVNGLTINSSEYFTVTYQGKDVLLTVVAGTAPTSAASVALFRTSSLVVPTNNALRLGGRGLGLGGQEGSFDFLHRNPMAVAASTSALFSKPLFDGQARSGASIQTTRSRNIVDEVAVLAHGGPARRGRTDTISSRSLVDFSGTSKSTEASPISFGTLAATSSQSTFNFDRRQLSARPNFDLGVISAGKLASQDSAGYQNSVTRSAFGPARGFSAGTTPNSLNSAGVSGAIRGRNNPTAAAPLHYAGRTSYMAVPLAYHVEPLSILEKGPKKALLDLWKQPGSSDGTNYLTIGRMQ